MKKKQNIPPASVALKALKLIKSAADIKSIKVIDTFEDDHCICFNFEMNGQFFERLWSNHTELAAVEYFNESIKAKQIVMQMVDNMIIILEDC